MESHKIRQNRSAFIGYNFNSYHGIQYNRSCLQKNRRVSRVNYRIDTVSMKMQNNRSKLFFLLFQRQCRLSNQFDIK